MLIDRFTNERAQLVSTIQTLARVAEDEERDLTEPEMETINRARERLGVIDSQINMLATDLDVSEDISERIRQIQSSDGGPQVSYPTAGHYLSDQMQAAQGNTEARSRLARYRKVLERVSPHETTADMPGAVPDPIIGPIVDAINGSRPFVNFIGTRQAVGPTFHRPVLNDALPTATAQGGEKTELDHGLVTVQRADVTMTTYGSYANISQQLLAYSNPSAGQVIIDALSRRYARITEQVAVTAVLASTGTVDVDIATVTADLFVKALYDAAGMYYATTGDLPTYLLTGVDGWKAMGSMVDANKRQIFPFLGPSNAAGQQSADSFAGNPLGLSLVVSWAVPAGNGVVGGPASQEFYERVWGEMSVTEPSVLGRQVAVAGDFGVYRPWAAAPIVIKDVP